MPLAEHHEVIAKATVWHEVLVTVHWLQYMVLVSAEHSLPWQAAVLKQSHAYGSGAHLRPARCKHPQDLYFFLCGEIMAKLNSRNTMSINLPGGMEKRPKQQLLAAARLLRCQFMWFGSNFWCCSADSLAALRMLAPRWTSTDRKVRGASSRHFWGLSR